MTTEQETVLLINGMIATLSEDQRKCCQGLANSFREQVTVNGHIGELALALVGAEFAAK